MDELGNINIFISEGAGIDSIIAEMEAKGEEVKRDAFGHIRLETINPGAWFGKQFAEKIGAEKVLVQKADIIAVLLQMQMTSVLSKDVSTTLLTVHFVAKAV